MQQQVWNAVKSCLTCEHMPDGSCVYDNGIIFSPAQMIALQAMSLDKAADVKFVKFVLDVVFRNQDRNKLNLNQTSLVQSNLKFIQKLYRQHVEKATKLEKTTRIFNFLNHVVESTICRNKK